MNDPGVVLTAGAAVGTVIGWLANHLNGKRNGNGKHYLDRDAFDEKITWLRGEMREDTRDLKDDLRSAIQGLQGSVDRLADRIK